MKNVLNSLGALFLSGRFFAGCLLIVLVYLLGYFFSPLIVFAHVGLGVVALLSMVDGMLLFGVLASGEEGVAGERIVPERLSNGDANPLQIVVTNRYPFRIRIEVIDELPYPFQVRDLTFNAEIGARGHQVFSYSVRPVERGEYHFGRTNVLVATPLGLIRRRFRISEAQSVPVYPSFMQMRTYELLAASNRLTEAGVKRIQRVGHTMEFERIREYVVGDDPRTVNWRATARRGELMVNQYQDERAQPVYCLLDMGRSMKMPFEGMTLLDYSINASLVLSNIALREQDRSGLMVFSHKMETYLPADKGIGQLAKILHHLYALSTDFKESDFALLYSRVRRHIRQRSLLLLFTNFESKSALERQLSYLKALQSFHLLVVIIFENTELDALSSLKPTDTESIYVRTVAQQYVLEKQAVVLELRRHGIYAVLTRPDRVSVETINTYLELKARGLF